MGTEDDVAGEAALISRVPTIEDLAGLCRELNALGAKYWWWAVLP